MLDERMRGTIIKAKNSSTKMQDYLPKNETVDHRDPDEWRYSRTADRHGDVLVHVKLLRLQRTAHDQIVSRMPVINLTTNPPLHLMQRERRVFQEARRIKGTTCTSLPRVFTHSATQKFFLITAFMSVVNPFRLESLSRYNTLRNHILVNGFLISFFSLCGGRVPRKK